MSVFFKRIHDGVTSMSGDLHNVAKYTRNFIFVGTYSTNPSTSITRVDMLWLVSNTAQTSRETDRRGGDCGGGGGLSAVNTAMKWCRVDSRPRWYTELSY
jgi:hypothetical protein